MPLEEIPMEESVRNILTEEQIYDDEWSISRNKLYFIVQFSVSDSNKMERILDRLAYFNIGKTLDSSIMVTEPTINVQKRNKGEKSGVISYSAIQNFIGTLKSRLCVAQNLKTNDVHFSPLIENGKYRKCPMIHEITESKMRTSSSTGRFEVVSVECQSESTYDPEQDDKGENNIMLRRNV
ncbi:unnamed protein product [Schistosoma margrebowiei]|uniref:Uncharacterized protein n=1 Tax=Schistosoma margrebowiei TaxID=48269 RepID=A0AA85APV2_9TREM|nr:unnamed protein product [Schistosoma margrebowiei]